MTTRNRKLAFEIAYRYASLGIVVTLKRQHQVWSVGRPVAAAVAA